jgi:hypothetical protein
MLGFGTVITELTSREWKKSAEKSYGLDHTCLCLIKIRREQEKDIGDGLNKMNGK